MILAGGAILVLLGLVAIGVLVFCLVFGDISANSGDISTKLNQALDRIQGWFDDLGVDDTQPATRHPVVLQPTHGRSGHRAQDRRAGQNERDYYDALKDAVRGGASRPRPASDDRSA